MIKKTYNCYNLICDWQKKNFGDVSGWNLTFGLQKIEIWKVNIISVWDVSSVVAEAMCGG